jgi:hypothetical protein
MGVAWYKARWPGMGSRDQLRPDLAAEIACGRPLRVRAELRHVAVLAAIEAAQSRVQHRALAVSDGSAARDARAARSCRTGRGSGGTQR